MPERRWFMQLAYRGAPFHGWQRQPHDPSVQQTLEEALATALRRPEPVAVTGAGRTDAGVNAAMMVAHADLPADTDAAALTRTLNALCGPDIALQGLTPVHPGAHARFDATSRTYYYYAHTGRSPFTGGLSWQAPSTLDFAAMNQAAALLLDTDDFTSFARLHSDARTNLCRVSRALWRPAGGPGRWVFEITADRFLRNMVRAVVGTLAQVGRGKMTPGEFQQVIDRRDRCAAGTSMPPGPLFLQCVTYPYYSPLPLPPTP